MMYNLKLSVSLIVLIIFISCGLTQKAIKHTDDAFVTKNVLHGQTMLQGLLEEANQHFAAPEGAYPRTTGRNGKLQTTSFWDWTPGFFPGSLWYVYEYTHNEQMKEEAVKWTEKLKPLEIFAGNHDLGFMMYCSYGNAYRLTGNEAYKQVLINAAKALSTRFYPKVGVIKSWEKFVSWHGDKTYYFPVIIDNMMNLEMLFFASKVTGDTSFRHIATEHALTTMKNHFRPDYSSYHVVCYDSTNGNVVAKETAQGYADNSTWSRGQAWAIYGYTMVYRETRDPRFLQMATGLANYYVDNKNLPEDKVAYWDFNINQPGFVPGVKSYASKVTAPYRDASAAAVTASALLELSTYVGRDTAAKFNNIAVKILHSLSTDTYTAQPGTNANFILKHSVGSIPHHVEIDVPLVYADYYYLEALLRYKRLSEGKSLF